ncbi:MAG: hypothetical protein U1E89_18570 [Burkholderiaceae bacterium]
MLAAAAAATATRAAVDTGLECPHAPRAVVERFISADCDACWTRLDSARSTTDAWVLDWIVPSARGDEAPLAAAAPAEASARAQRRGVDLASDSALTQRTPLPVTAGDSLAVTAGPAWYGYFGVQLDVKGHWPAGSSAWMALVEAVPRGTDGTPVPRHLVRNVAGPIAVDRLEADQRETRAMRWPETAKPQRLVASAWIETTDGRIVAFARDGCARR